MTKKSPDTERTQLQNEEHEKHPVGNAKDAFDRAQAGVPDTAGMKAKELGGAILLIVLLLIGFGIYQYFF
ncbi:DUF6366 family protein [Chryseomicrobium palamuruense]|uniref:DUF6366 family protein n=1 Tax=Chryseomicrobium palamuruense TaxID=682973 RepID=A0ABV8UR90_9BACL